MKEFLRFLFDTGIMNAIVSALVCVLVTSIMTREHEKCKAKKQEPYKHIRAQFNQNEMDTLRLIRSGKLTDSEHCPMLCSRFEACGLITGNEAWGFTVDLRLTEFGEMLLTAYEEE